MAFRGEGHVHRARIFLFGRQALPLYEFFRRGLSVRLQNELGTTARTGFNITTIQYSIRGQGNCGISKALCFY